MEEEAEEEERGKREREMLGFLKCGHTWEMMSVIFPREHESVSLRLQRRWGDSVSVSC